MLDQTMLLVALLETSQLLAQAIRETPVSSPNYGAFRQALLRLDFVLLRLRLPPHVETRYLVLRQGLGSILSRPLASVDQQLHQAHLRRL